MLEKESEGQTSTDAKLDLICQNNFAPKDIQKKKIKGEKQDKEQAYHLLLYLGWVIS